MLRGVPSVPTPLPTTSPSFFVTVSARGPSPARERATSSDSSNTAPKVMLVRLLVPPNSLSRSTTAWLLTGPTLRADYSEESAVRASWRRAPTTGSGAKRESLRSLPMSSPHHSHGGPTTCATRQSPRGLTQACPQRRSRSGRGTASRSCSRSTRSASQGRTSWRGNGSRPRCTRRSREHNAGTYRARTAVEHRFGWTQPDNQRRPLTSSEQVRGPSAMVDRGAPGGSRTRPKPLIGSCGVPPSQGPIVHGLPPRPACSTAAHSVLTTVSTTATRESLPRTVFAFLSSGAGAGGIAEASSPT